MLIFQVTKNASWPYHNYYLNWVWDSFSEQNKKTIYLLISGINRGDVVSVYCDLENKCRKGLIKPFSGQKVFLGNGIAALARKEIFCSDQSVRCVYMTLASWGRGYSTKDLPYTPKLQPLPLYYTVFSRKCSFVSFSYTFLWKNSCLFTYSWLLITQTFKGNRKRFELSGAQRK